MNSTQRRKGAKWILFCRIGSPNGERWFKGQFHFLPLRLRVFASLRLKWAASFRLGDLVRETAELRELPLRAYGRRPRPHQRPQNEATGVEFYIAPCSTKKCGAG